jgi:hypothetical protein
MKARVFVSLVGGVAALFSAAIGMAVTAPGAFAGARGDRLMVVDLPASMRGENISLVGTNGFGKSVSTPTFTVTSSTFYPSQLANWSWEGQVKVIVAPKNATSIQQATIGYCNVTNYALDLFQCAPQWAAAYQPAPPAPSSGQTGAARPSTPSHPAAPPPTGRPIEIVNDVTGECIGDPRWSNRAGTAMVQGKCNGTANLEWIFHLAPGARWVFTIKNEWSHLCLDSRGEKPSGTTVVQRPCNGTRAQWWALLGHWPNDPNAVTLWSDAAGLNLDLSGDQIVENSVLNSNHIWLTQGWHWR